MFERLEKYFKKDHIDNLLSKYDEKWRKIHTRNHLEYIISKILLDINKYSEKELDVLYLTCLFHDIIYLPWSKTNEEDSAKLFKLFWNENGLMLDKDIENEVYENILATKEHKDNTFNYYDMYVVLHEKNPTILLEWEEGVFKEFSFVPYNKYKEARIEFLKKYTNKNDSLLFLIDYVESRHPKVGFYAGSFNPFHVGHLSIINQSEKLFDKVVILIGQNASKAPLTNEEIEVRKKHIFKKTGIEVEFFEGLLPNYIKLRSFLNNEEPFLIRGIRNEDDFKSEEVQARYMKTIWKDLNLIYLTCPAELNFVSSSGIKAMNMASINSGDVFIPNDLF